MFGFLPEFDPKASHLHLQCSCDPTDFNIIHRIKTFFENILRGIGQPNRRSNFHSDIYQNIALLLRYFLIYLITCMHLMLIYSLLDSNPYHFLPLDVHYVLPFKMIYFFLIFYFFDDNAQFLFCCQLTSMQIY